MYLKYIDEIKCFGNIQNFINYFLKFFQGKKESLYKTIFI